ncbi:NAD(P)/FAD-dependent oxidoreductase [candidate division KSB1 bacterium]|nr:NAD(P)/FAD-dependent oxidoreductase [candidate division KSB1 bacterium]
MKTEFDIIVIGGGASGLMAAGRASELGARVAVLEKKHKPGLKLGITGKGRCNICNDAPLEDSIDAFGRNGKFLYNCFGHFHTAETLALFESYGLKCKRERGGRYFPIDDSAHSVRDALMKFNRMHGTSIFLNHAVKRIHKSGNLFVCQTADATFSAPIAIISTGGLSYPGTGSEGDGYRFAKQFGHTVTPLKPGLAAVITEEPVSELEGLSLRQVAATLLVGERKINTLQGDALFTTSGLSGPIILTLSLQWARLATPPDAAISIDWKPALDFEKLAARLDRDILQNSKKSLNNNLRLLLPSRFIPIFLSRLDLPPEKAVAQLNRAERIRIVSLLKAFRFRIKSHEPIETAIVTEGGIRLSEIDPKTLASKRVPGLHFTGEILDLAGETGGFNLQMSWSTGYVAGEAAAKASALLRDAS